MFQIFMMLTNGAMCVMSTWSFAQSFYDNYNKKAAEIIKNPAVAVPSKLVHLGSGFMYHEHHSYSIIYLQLSYLVLLKVMNMRKLK